MKNSRTKLSPAEFERYEPHYPSNVVIVEVEQRRDIKTSAGISVGFNPDVNYSDQAGEDQSSHPADVAVVYGTIAKQVEKLYFNKKDVNHTMSWKTEIETAEDDIVWFHPLISKNCCEIEVGDKLYKVIPYEDLFVAKRMIWVDKWTGTKKEVIIPLNGYVILETLVKPRLSELDVLDKDIDKTKGIVRWNGRDNDCYIYPGKVDMTGLKEGDLVEISKDSYPFFLERSKYNSNFDKGNQYFVVQKKDIIAVL